MSARDKLLALFPHLPHLDASNRALIEVAVDEILSDHAHELAEKVRRSVGVMGQSLAAAEVSYFVRKAADLIDPEVKS